MGVSFPVVLVIFCFKVFLAQNVSEHGTSKIRNIEKRQLRWTSNFYIDNNQGSKLKIDYLKPHLSNPGILDGNDYMAFTLYMRNDQWEVPNTGIFHFVGSDVANQYRHICQSKTLHAGAYVAFYHNCPEADKPLVSSGYCYRGTTNEGLVFNSYTFNDGSKPWANTQYYSNTTNKVHDTEVDIIKWCFNSWKNSGFQVSSWRCATSGIPLSAGLTSNSRLKRASGGCSGCECPPSSDSLSPLHNNVFLMIIVICFTYFVNTQDFL